MKYSGETGGPGTITVEQAQKIYKRNCKRIRKIVKEKVAIYHPLEFEEAFPGFCQWIEKDEFGALRTLPESPTKEKIEACLEKSIRHYLIEQSYYKLEERFVSKRIMRELGIYDPNDIKFEEVSDFVVEHLERNRFRKLKTFMEGSLFSTYLATAVTSLLADYWRSVGAAQKNVKKALRIEIVSINDEFDGQENEEDVRQEISFWDLFQKESQDPFEVAAKKEYLEYFPEVWNELDQKQKLVMRLKYEQDLNTSLIARTLDESRYKTEQFIRQTEFFIKKEIMLKLEKERRQQ